MENSKRRRRKRGKEEERRRRRRRRRKEEGEEDQEGAGAAWPKTLKSQKSKSVTDGWTDQQTDRRTKLVVESR